MQHNPNKTISPAEAEYFFDRDLSWLSFNERLLMESERTTTPLMERMNFLSIYSSNLDEFYRVRMPALTALHKLHKRNKLGEAATEKHKDIAARAKDLIAQQQVRFGQSLHKLVPELEKWGIHFIYGKPLPEAIMPQLKRYFFTYVLAFLKPVVLHKHKATFFPENNQLYLAVCGQDQDQKEQVLLVNIPTNELSRFFELTLGKQQYIVFLDDIVKAHLHLLTNLKVEGSYSFKVTRDAELGLDEIYEEDVAAAIEKQLLKRDMGLATRLLYEPGLPEGAVNRLLDTFGLERAVVMEGGRYHNLRDLRAFSVKHPRLYYQKWLPVQQVITEPFLLDRIAREDLLLHTPYHAYDPVLRFFNEAAIRPEVARIYITLYRVASDSKIVNALITAAHNGKKVVVVVELKARFDEANNLKWAKKMKQAGVQVLYTRNELKVHAKVALIEIEKEQQSFYLGLLATGNLNESTARFYTDHVLLTGQQEMLKEVKQLFLYLQSKEIRKNKLNGKHLLIAQFNLQERLLELIEREIDHARMGKAAGIIIKLNNLEERVLISKLYEASTAGVQIQLIIRGICCLVPGVEGMSENITVRRIVDRYLEHGRVYVFQNGGRNDLFLGSADWMNRNIHKRVEVCFPLYDERLKAELLELINLQLRDNMQAVELDANLQNVPVKISGRRIQSQQAIYKKLRGV